MKKTVLSGIRATGRLHLGNYLGAVKGMLELQNSQDYQTLYMVADVHTLTTPYDVEELRTHRRQVIMDYVAAGLDPEKSILFLQATVPQHLELAFYFSSVTTIARMQHLPTFKDKVKQHPDHATMALLNYPILMAADILVYKAGLVPVGIDQEPHLEVAREIARKMNAQYGLDFPEPQRFATKGEYVPSLQGSGKMSKSVEGSFINLTDDLATIEARLAATPTDSGKGEQVPTEGGVANLLTMVELFQGTEAKAELEQAYLSTGIRYKDLKKNLAAAIYQELEPIQDKRRSIEADSKYVDDVIATGSERAQAIAGATLVEVKEALGLG
jgi:tryptophanyl-tRNA synthetase